MPQLRTNKGRQIGGGSTPGPAVQIAHPCPVGAYRLAYIGGDGATSKQPYLLGLTLVWAPVAGLGTSAAATLVYGGSLCQSPQPPAPAPAPPPLPDANFAAAGE
jgi:hypothetical protein